MKRIGFLAIVLNVFWMVLLVLSLIFISKTLHELDDPIGTEVIFNGDTLMVVDYIVFGDDYLLEDGIKISSTLFDRLEQIK